MHSPTTGAEIQAAYTQAWTDALGWTNQVYAQLAEVPDDVLSYNTTISALLADATTQAETLIANPGDATASELLNQDLKNITSTLSLVNIFIKGVQSSMTTFGVSTLTNAAAQLTLVTTDAYTDVSIDQAAIKQYQMDIDNLNSEIKALQVELGIDSAAVVGGGIALSVGLLSCNPAEAIMGGLALALA